MGRLNTKSPFINPFWFNKTQGKKYEVLVENESEVVVEGEILYSKEPLPVGEKIYVSMGRHLTYKTEAERQEEDKERQKRIREHEENRRRELNDKRKKAESLNAELNIPVKWSAAIKPVLSGLLENSWGDGTRKSTVYHILLEERLEDGRLKRNSGDFLCTSKSESKGNFYELTQPLYKYDGDGEPYVPAITCRQCRKVAARWLRST